MNSIVKGAVVMYNPYEKNYNQQDQETNSGADGRQPTAPGYGTGASPYTAQTGGGQPGTGQPETVQTGNFQSGASQPGGAGYSEPRRNEAAPGGNNSSVTYHSGPIHTGSAYIPPQPANPQPANPQPPRTAYTWNPGAQSGGVYTAPQQAPYYAPVQPPKQKKPKQKKGGRFVLKLIAAVLCCAVVSFGSVGVFALMIQNGVVNVENPSGGSQTAAFTIYKRADDSQEASTPTVTGQSLTPQEAAAKVTPSVVCVQNYQITRQSGGFFGFYSDYSDYDEDESGISPAGEGSGIVISKDGYIVTNQHVVDGATSLKVVTSEGLTYEAELVGEDTQTDLAVIKVDTQGDELTPAEFGSSSDLQVADDVMAIGNPGGMQLNSSATFGRVSALNRQVENSETGYTIKCIQTDAAVNPGNSGGALVDMDGHVVGIVSSKIVSTEYEGLGFAIPSDTVQPIVSDLIEYGYVKDRPMLGISGQYIDRMTASFYGMNAGYYVVQVTSENAQRSGLQRGDMITAIDDTQVTSANTISSYIAGKKPGDTVTLTVDRSASGQGAVQIELVLSENTGKSTGNGRG